jgi:hypothetical protein
MQPLKSISEPLLIIVLLCSPIAVMLFLESKKDLRRKSICVRGFRGTRTIHRRQYPRLFLFAVWFDFAIATVFMTFAIGCLLYDHFVGFFNP